MLLTGYNLTRCCNYILFEPSFCSLSSANVQKSEKKLYGINEALKYVLLPDGNSSDLDDNMSDDEVDSFNRPCSVNDDEFPMSNVAGPLQVLVKGMFENSNNKFETQQSFDVIQRNGGDTNLSSEISDKAASDSEAHQKGAHTKKK